MKIALLFITLFLQIININCYLIREPDADRSINWKTHGPQRLSWDRVDTDSKWFTVVLTNQDRSILPRDIVIDKFVDGTRLNILIWPPRSGFPTGQHFRINLVKSANEPNIIYAQSNEFSITY